MVGKDNISDYQMGHRPTETGATVDNITLNGDVMPNDFYTHPHYYADMNDQSYKESYKAILNVKDNPNAEIEIYRAGVNGELNNGDWVTLSKTYALEHSNSEFGDNAQVNKYTVNVSNVHFAGDDINEFGFFADEKTVEKANETLEVIHSITVLNKSNISEYASENQIEQLSELIERIGDNNLTIKYDSTEKVAMVDIEDQVSFDLEKNGTATFFTLDDTPTTTNTKELLDMIENQGITLESKSINLEVNAMSNEQSKSIENDLLDQKKEEFLSNYTGNDELSRIVIEQGGGFEHFESNAIDIANNGAGGGFNGWIDSYQMGEWVENNHDTILTALKNDCDEFGIESVKELLDPTGKKFADYSENEINAVIFEADRENDASLTVMTSIAYYVVEKVSSEYSIAKEEIEAQFKEPNQFDSISDFLKSNHEINSDQKNILNSLDNYLEKNDIQMNGLTIEEDGRKKGEITIEINNMQKDENGNFKNDVLMTIHNDEVTLSGGANELDTTYKINSLNSEKQFFAMADNLDNQLKDKFEIRIHDEAESTKIKTFDQENALNVFSNIDKNSNAELFVNNEKVASHKNDNDFHFVAVNEDHKLGENIINAWLDQEKSGKAELFYSLPEQDIAKHQKGNEKQKDDGFSLG